MTKSNIKRRPEITGVGREMATSRFMRTLSNETLREMLKCDASEYRKYASAELARRNRKNARKNQES